MKMVQLLPLFPKRLSDLTLDDLTLVQRSLGLELEVTEELKQAGLALLSGKSIDTVADLIQSPESLQQLLAMFRSQRPVVPPQRLEQCPHCSEFFLARA